MFHGITGSDDLYLTHQLSPQSFDGSGCLTLDLVRCRLSARAVGLIYNWWSWYTRLALPEIQKEAITSRALTIVCHRPQHKTRGAGPRFTCPTCMTHKKRWNEESIIFSDGYGLSGRLRSSTLDAPPGTFSSAISSPKLPQNHGRHRGFSSLCRTVTAFSRIMA